MTLGPSLVTTLGYSMPEVGETYERGLLLSRRLGGEHLFSVAERSMAFSYRSRRPGGIQATRGILR